MTTSQLADFIEDTCDYTYTDIRYTQDGVLIKEQLFPTDRPRLLFAKLLSSFSVEVEIIIGNNVRIGENCNIGGKGFGYVLDEDGKKIDMPHLGNVVIEDDVVIHNLVNIDRAVTGSTVIGKGSKIDTFCHIAHNAQIGRHNTLAAGCIVEGSVEIGDYNTFGSGVIFQRKVKVGSYCRFGSGSVIVKDVPDYSVVVGNPGKIIRENR